MPSRRAILASTLLLLAGAVVNVAVAWGLAALGRKPPVQVGLPAITFWNFGSDEVHFEQPMFVSLGAQEARKGRPHWHERGAATGSVIRAGFGHWQCWAFGPSTHAFGWPALTLKYVAPIYPGEPHDFALKAPAAVTSRGLFAKSEGFIPTGLIPRGAVVNTLFYTAILALPLSFFPIRRRLRARRGRCPTCGYDRAGLGGADPAAPCPECGAAP